MKGRVIATASAPRRGPGPVRVVLPSRVVEAPTLARALELLAAAWAAQ